MSDTPQLLLNHHLKKLRLPTFLSEYDKQARQCAAENKGHVDYLLRLSELELIERERRMIERRIKGLCQKTVPNFYSKLSRNVTSAVPSSSHRTCHSMNGPRSSVPSGSPAHSWTGSRTMSIFWK